MQIYTSIAIPVSFVPYCMLQGRNQEKKASVDNRNAMRSCVLLKCKLTTCVYVRLSWKNGFIVSLIKGF